MQFEDRKPPPFVDVHCHLLPLLDDGARSWEEARTMAAIAARDGIRTVVATPHQLGNFSHNSGAIIRKQVDRLQQVLRRYGVPLQVQAGADVRVEEGMVSRLVDGQVLTLADKHRHVLLELPHEQYLPIDGLLKRLTHAGMVGVLSHPERNRGLMARPQLAEQLVKQGCLMQVTAGSLLGSFGDRTREAAEYLLQRGAVHFVATDAHGSQARRPLMRRAFERVTRLTDWDTAVSLFCHNPQAVVMGHDPVVAPLKRRPFVSWISWRKVG